MKKLAILVLSLLTVTGLVGCEETTHELNLDNHIKTMDSMDTYVMEIESNRQTTNGDVITKRYIYVDNTNSTFLVSDHEKDPVSVENGDVIFEVLEDEIFGYFFTDVWTKYELSPDYSNLKYFESIIFDFFTDDTVTVADGMHTYESTTTLATLIGNIFNMFEMDFAEEDMSIEFPISAIYSSKESRFLSFEFNLNPIINQGSFHYPDTTDWKITLTFDVLNEDFELNIIGDIHDDYVGDFNQSSILEIVHRFCFEMIRGSIDFSIDKDLFKVEFEDDGIYQIKATKLNNIDNLYIHVLDEYRNPIRTFKLDAEDRKSVV